MPLWEKSCFYNIVLLRAHFFGGIIFVASLTGYLGIFLVCRNLVQNHFRSAEEESEVALILLGFVGRWDHFHTEVANMRVSQG